MTTWIVATLAVWTAVCCVCLCVPKFGSTRWRDKVVPAWKQGLSVGSIVTVLAFASYPLGCIVDCVIDRCGAWRRSLLELWILFWTAATLILVFYGIDKWPRLVFLPLLVLFDTLYLIISLLVSPPPKSSPARALVLDLVRYIQVVGAFACVYLSIQHLTGSCLFMINNSPGHLNPEEALYFSVTTGTTIGFGDITPHVAGISSLPKVLRPSVLVFFEVFCIFYIFAIDMPRLIGQIASPGAVELPLRKRCLRAGERVAVCPVDEVSPSLRLCYSDERDEAADCLGE